MKMYSCLFGNWLYFTLYLGDISMFLCRQLVFSIFSFFSKSGIVFQRTNKPPLN